MDRDRVRTNTEVHAEELKAALSAIGEVDRDSSVDACEIERSRAQEVEVDAKELERLKVEMQDVCSKHEANASQAWGQC